MNKEGFIQQLNMLLTNANMGVENLFLDVDSYGDETIRIDYSNGNTKNVRISGDSRYQIIQDVLKHFKP